MRINRRIFGRIFFQLNRAPVRRPDGPPERLVDLDVPRQVWVGGGSVDGEAPQEDGCR